MKLSLLISFFVVSLAPSDPPESGEYTYLKEWSILTSSYERSYVMTRGTNYILAFDPKSTNTGEIILEDCDRNLLLKAPTQTGSVEWQCQSTGIRYIRFVNLEKSIVKLGFKR